jgi:sodium/bile acid cotransporter 7
MSFLRTHWFIAALLVIVVLGVTAPEWAPRLGHWQDGLFALMFLITGLTLPGKALTGAIRDWRFHALVQGLSLLVIPVMGMGLDQALALTGMDPHLRLGVLLTCCLPTTISSCVLLTRLAGGDEAAAVTTAALGNLIGILATPAWAFVAAGAHLTVEPGPVILHLLLVIALPMAAGQLLRPWLAAWAERHRSRLNTLSTVALLTAMWGIIATAAAHGVALPFTTLLGLTTGILAGFLALLACAWWVFGACHLGPQRRIAATICGTQRTAALGLPVLSALLAGDPALGLCLAPLILWHLIQNLVLGALTPAFKRTLP